MTVLELINAIENARGDYDDLVELVRHTWRDVERFEITQVEYTAGGEDGYGAVQLFLSRK